MNLRYLVRMAWLRFERFMRCVVPEGFCASAVRAAIISSVSRLPRQKGLLHLLLISKQNSLSGKNFYGRLGLL